MQKRLTALALALCAALCLPCLFACSSSSSSSIAASMQNPMTEVSSADQMSEEIGINVSPSSFWSNVKYFVYDLNNGKMGEMQFEFQSVKCSFRAMKTTDSKADISGLNGEFNGSSSETIFGENFNIKTLKDGTGGMAYYYDSDNQTMYCLVAQSDKSLSDWAATLIELAGTALLSNFNLSS